MKQIPLVIVESHQHVLEHVHYILRKQKLFQKWTMIHYDAHPDLACSPDLPARLCFLPRCWDKSLYERLDETPSGIAEWILPLVLGAGLERIYWIKPSSSQQLPLGNNHYRVGVKTKNNQTVESFLDLEECAVVRVDWNHPYYLDDDTVEAHLQMSRTLSLHVHNEDQQVTMNDTTPWMLDICLDYFICRNPYVVDLEKINTQYTKLVVTLNQRGLEIAESNLHQYREKRQECLEAFKSLLLGKDEGESLKEYLGTDCNDKVDRIRSILSDYAVLADMTLEALPHLNMPHDKATEISWDDIDRTIQAVIPETVEHAPFLITVARSSLDGFCPPGMVERLQKKILEKLNSRYNPSLSCTLQVVRDYGEWEGSTLDRDEVRTNGRINRLPKA
jgi:hypothetical protein